MKISNDFLGSILGPNEQEMIVVRKPLSILPCVCVCVCVCTFQHSHIPQPSKNAEKLMVLVTSLTKLCVCTSGCVHVPTAFSHSTSYRVCVGERERQLPSIGHIEQDSTKKLVALVAKTVWYVWRVELLSPVSGLEFSFHWWAEGKL